MAMATPEKRLEWKVGLQNPVDKFLTAETYGHKVNVSGASLKVKQTWVLELNKDETVYIRSHLGLYLTADKFGNVSCSSESHGEDEKFMVEYASDGTGRWSFKHPKFGKYLGGTDEDIQCLAKVASDEDMSLWYVPMAMHPQITLFNVNRKRYVKLDNNELRCIQLTPWGPEALITLEFKCGKYAFKTADSRYLTHTGHLTDEHGKNTKFSLELKLSADSDLAGLAFKDCEGKYLTAYGGSGVLKTRNKIVSRDELFSLMESHPQVIFIASNGKQASIRQGLEVTASQAETGEKEIFQIEYIKKTKKWSVYTTEGKYWRLDNNGSIIADVTSADENCQFDLTWQKDGTAVIKWSNGKYLLHRGTGALIANSDTISEKEMFVIRVVNRPVLVLKGENGYLSMISSGSCTTRYACNKSTYDVLQLERGPGGAYFVKGENSKYWTLGPDNSVQADSATPIPFIFEFNGDSEITIRAPNDMYLKGEKSGGFAANSPEPRKDCVLRF
ncbi:fascin-like [Mizuhopecten yessoensis]|uniref:Fascin n=1 Tax=Mizuhopecten yessoensis TaxID=6573 RepID=A0A210Q1J2_MIZYE|nr:fascin-like [Mizuhopecten yessoensis]OWF42575.1 Fascin [Mizuhopecten yessoensis]